MLAATFAHNLLQRLQVQQLSVRSNREWLRPTCRIFEKAERIRLTVLQGAGKITPPKNRPTLTVSGDRNTEARFTTLLEQFRPTA